MLEFLIALAIAVAAWVAGRKSGKDESKVEREGAYHDTSKRIDAVTRADDFDVVDRLRAHANGRSRDL